MPGAKNRLLNPTHSVHQFKLKMNEQKKLHPSPVVILQILKLPFEVAFVELKRLMNKMIKE